MRGVLTADEVELLHRYVAPCRGCGSLPLTPAHRLRARENTVCAERVADVVLMVQLIVEKRRRVPPFRPGDPLRRRPAA